MLGSTSRTQTEPEERNGSASEVEAEAAGLAARCTGRVERPEVLLIERAIRRGTRKCDCSMHGGRGRALGPQQPTKETLGKYKTINISSFFVGLLVEGRVITNKKLKHGPLTHVPLRLRQRPVLRYSTFQIEIQVVR